MKKCSKRGNRIEEGSAEGNKGRGRGMRKGLREEDRGHAEKRSHGLGHL